MSEIVKCAECDDSYFGFEDPAVKAEDGKIYHRQCLEKEDVMEAHYKKYSEIDRDILDTLAGEQDLHHLSRKWTVISATGDYEYCASGFDTYKEMEEYVCQEDDGGGWEVDLILKDGKPVKYSRQVEITLKIEDK